MKNKGDERGDCKTRAYKHADQNRGKGKRRQATADAKSSEHGELQACQVKSVDLLVSGTRTVFVQKTRTATFGIFRSAPHIKRTVQARHDVSHRPHRQR